ncbi:MAG: hypothetical protein B7Z73_00015 [Planctomycetia bacterium 21-64-5]|nr:MAG: hypothetical protein B7Z73_00015 [Planctomycetia bacterium 21-64-5]
MLVGRGNLGERLPRLLHVVVDRLERGSEANAPLARAILGGLLAAGPATLFVLPAIYSRVVRTSVLGERPG